MQNKNDKNREWRNHSRFLLASRSIPCNEVMKVVCKQEAMALIHGDTEHPDLRGTVRFFQKDSCVLIVARIHRLPETQTGFFGFHLHTGVNCTGENFSGTAGHYDPGIQPHPSHAGDLPPLLDCGGNAYLAVETDRFRLCDVLGRTVVIHSRPDDFKSQPAGDAGTKIACGKICPI